MSFQQKLVSGNFMVLAEADPPKGVDISGLITHARRLKDRIDAVVVPDMDNGVMRLSALAAAVILQQQGLETLIHVYGRDRNRMALQADLLGAHVLGIRNLIVVRGEAMANGDHRDAALVDDLDELGLLRAAQSLQEGIDLSGFALKGSPTFTVGCTLAPWSDEPGLERELAAAAQKIAVGAPIRHHTGGFRPGTLRPAPGQGQALGRAPVRDRVRAEIGRNRSLHCHQRTRRRHVRENHSPDPSGTGSGNGMSPDRRRDDFGAEGTHPGRQNRHHGLGKPPARHPRLCGILNACPPPGKQRAVLRKEARSGGRPNAPRRSLPW